jgi:hypothetical protein
LTHEEYQSLTLPQVRNFSIAEKDRSQALAALKVDEMLVKQGNKNGLNGDDEASLNSGLSKKTIIILIIIILLAAVFAVGIYFAIDLST